MLCVLFCSCSLFKGNRTGLQRNNVSLDTSIPPEPEYLEESIKITELMDKSDPLLPKKKELITFKIGNEIHGNKKILELNKTGTDNSKFLFYKMLSFFPRSEFEIDKTMRMSARNVFKPMVDSLFQEQAKMPQTSFIAKIIVAGYSDAVAIKEGSPTFTILKDKMKSMNLSSHSMNSYLSFLRANAVASILKELILERATELKSYDKVYIELLMEGRGEALPDSKKKFKVDDERRRIVKLFWHVASE